MAKKSIEQVITDIESTGVFKADFDTTFAYTGNKQNLPARCLAKDHRVEVRLNNILARKTGCAECAGKAKKSIQQVIKDVINTGIYKPDFDETFQYKNNNQKLPLVCLREGHHHEASLHSIMGMRIGCAKCGGK